MLGTIMVNKYAPAQPRGLVPPLLELEFRNPAQRFLEFLNLSVFRQMDAEVITDQGSRRPTRDPCDPCDSWLAHVGARACKFQVLWL